MSISYNTLLGCFLGDGSPGAGCSAARRRGCSHEAAAARNYLFSAGGSVADSSWQIQPRDERHGGHKQSDFRRAAKVGGSVRNCFRSVASNDIRISLSLSNSNNLRGMGMGMGMGSGSSGNLNSLGMSGAGRGGSTPIMSMNGGRLGQGSYDPFNDLTGLNPPASNANSASRTGQQPPQQQRR